MLFIGKKFLLQIKTAQRFYHNYAKDLPIIDYHNHLNPKEIAENRQFNNLTEKWIALKIEGIIINRSDLALKLN